MHSERPDMTLQCPTCQKSLASARHVFALQAQQVEYTQPGETPDEQAALKTLALTTLKRYCTSACCKAQLPELFEQLGLPAELQFNRVAGGPLCPCGHCGKPVNMTQVHVGVIRGHVTLESDGQERYPDAQTMHTILCKSCMGTHAQALMAFLREHQKKTKAAQRKAQRAQKRQEERERTAAERLRTGPA